MFDLFDSTAILAKASDLGIDRIHCSLTGRLISTIAAPVMLDAIRYAKHVSPLASDEEILDAMQLRWIVACSRPAPHLVGFANHDAFTYLADNHPRDLFAILISRMLFEFAKRGTENIGSLNQKEKLLWLIQLQESEAFQAFDSEWKEALETLVRLDAIHNIRHVFYSNEMRELASQVRDEPLSDTFATMILTFVKETETKSLRYLAGNKVRPEGNQQSLNAALRQAGLLPYQVQLEVKEKNRKQKSIEFAAKVEKDRQERELERIKNGFADKNPVAFSEIEDSIQRQIADRMETALMAAQVEKELADSRGWKPKMNTKAVKESKAKAAGLKKYGSLDFSL